MAYLDASINPSPTIIARTEGKAEELRHKAVSFDDNGNLKACEVGKAPIGIVISCVDEDDTELSVLIKDIGYALVGETIKAGDELAVGADGKLVKATAGSFIVGYAVKGAETDGIANVQITKSGYKAGEVANG